MPENPENFHSVYYVLHVGSDVGPGADLFHLNLCTPNAFASDFQRDAIETGRHMLFVGHYDARRIVGWIIAYLDSCTGETWQEVAERVARIADWEFEDYNRGGVRIHLSSPEDIERLRAFFNTNTDIPLP